MMHDPAIIIIRDTTSKQRVNQQHEASTTYSTYIYTQQTHIYTLSTSVYCPHLYFIFLTYTTFSYIYTLSLVVLACFPLPAYHVSIPLSNIQVVYMPSNSLYIPSVRTKSLTDNLFKARDRVSAYINSKGCPLSSPRLHTDCAGCTATLLPHFRPVHTRTCPTADDDHSQAARVISHHSGAARQPSRVCTE
jgi:hypothetical protein